MTKSSRLNLYDDQKHFKIEQTDTECKISTPTPIRMVSEANIIPDVVAQILQNKADILVEQTRFVFKEFTTQTPAAEIKQLGNLSNNTIETITDTTLNVPLGTYRTTFQAQYDVNIGNCNCSNTLASIITSLEAVTTVSHAAAYGYGETLLAGAYYLAGAITHTGVITLDGNNDPDAVFIIRSGAALDVAASASVVLTNGAQAKNVFWLAVGAIGISTGCTLIGTYIGKAAIAAGVGLNLIGRFFTSLGAIAFGSTTTVNIPSGIGQFDLGMLQIYGAYTIAGAISTTLPLTAGNENTDTFKIETALGAVTGFGVPYDGDYPKPLSEIKISFGIYKGEILSPSSLIIRTFDNLSNNRYINISSTLLITAENQRDVSVRVRIYNDIGGVIVGNRSLFLWKIDPII